MQRILRLIHTMKGFLLDVLFPNHCFGCGAHGVLFCKMCLNRSSEPDRTRSKHTIFVFSLMRYSNPACRNAIRAMKYRSLHTVAEILGRHLASYLYEMRSLMGNDVYVVPVPLSKKRMRRRGYNQAEKLSSTIAEIHGWRHANALIKIRDTKSQTECATPKERQKNVKGSFSVAPDFSPEAKTILLVDDVYTSGATIDECARVLKDAGAKKLYGAVIAKG